MARQEASFSGLVSAGVVFIPIAIALAIDPAKQSPLLYVFALLVSLAAGGLAYLKDRAEQGVRHSMEAERDRLVGVTVALTAEKASLAVRLANVSAALRGLETEELTLESFVTYLLEELHKTLGFTSSRTSFLAHRDATGTRLLNLFPANQSIVLCTRGMQFGQNVPSPWLIKRGTETHRVALRCMRNLGLDSMLRQSEPPRIDGMNLETLRGPVGQALPEAWCRAPVVSKGTPFGIVCIDAFETHEWTTAELNIASSFATLLGLGFMTSELGA